VRSSWHANRLVPDLSLIATCFGLSSNVQKASLRATRIASHPNPSERKAGKKERIKGMMRGFLPDQGFIDGERDRMKKGVGDGLSIRIRSAKQDSDHLG